MPHDWIYNYLSVFVSVIDELRAYGELLLVLATVLLVVVTWLLSRSTSRAAQIAQATHVLARTLAEFQSQPARLVEVEDIDVLPQSLTEHGSRWGDCIRKWGRDKFRNLKVTNVGSGPACIHRIVYGEKEDRGTAEPGESLVVYPRMFVRFQLDGLRDMFSASGSKDVECRIEYADRCAPPAKHVYKFLLRCRGVQHASILVIPGALQ